MSCAEDWWDAQQDELPFDDEPETDDECGEYLSETWWRQPWPVYKDTVHANDLPDISLWEPAA